MKEDNINQCQYWNANEPTACIHWDSVATICTYSGDDVDAAGNATIVLAEQAPYCNLLGTYVSCLQYTPSEPGAYKARCILPDARRHVCNRSTGAKWVIASGTSGSYSDNGYEILEWDFDAIDGYNDGECDGMGTNVTCSGYSSYHLGFGVLKPSDTEGMADTFENGKFSTVKELGYRLPTNFVICNMRAKLSRCYWWKTESSDFSVNGETGKVELLGTWACSCPKDTSAYSEFSLENGPPCNGCKPECGNYTGVCWKYCVDEKMGTGDPILAEQIHELRYYHRENGWTQEALQNLFMDEGTIYAWDGTKSSGKENEIASGVTLKGQLDTTIGDDGRVESYILPAVKVFMPSFEEFTIETENVVLSAGTTVTSELENYPTLVRQLQLLPLAPIIQTEFNVYTDLNGQSFNLFETPYLKRDQSVLIYGKVFYSNPVYAINLSDSDIRDLMPLALYYFDDMYSAKESLSPENYENFIVELIAKFTALTKVAPEKIFSNTLSDLDLTFIIDVTVLSLVDTFDGTSNNTILVFQEVNGSILYDKITFTKRVVGGMLFQNNFVIEGDGLELIPEIPYFEKSFLTTLNNNGTIGFNFVPFEDSGISTESLYVYNDSFIRDPIDSEGYAGYVQYKVTIDQYLLQKTKFNDTPREYKSIGSNGYILITLNDLKINSVIKPFEVEEIIATYTQEFLNSKGEVETKSHECEMEIVYHGAEHKLACNHLLVKPKNMEDFSSICGDVFVQLKNLTYWEKRSFGQSIDIDKGTLEEDMPNNTTSAFNVGEFSGTKDEFTIKNYKFAMVPSVVMADSQGRPFTQSRTKPLGVVKQVGCPDVEIRYIWQGVYTRFKNYPVCLCCGPWTERWSGSGILYTEDPPCGDHFECKGCYPAALWWPYNRCQQYKSYSEVSAHDNYDFSMIALFKEKDEDGEYLHGAHDMRMLGPDYAYANGGLFCNPLKICACERETFNYYREGDPYFMGSGKVRAGVSDVQIAIWRATGSDPVMQFGNEVRSVLRSYRTLDQAPYIAFNPSTGMPYTEWKLMPAAQMFSRADITADVDEMWDYFASSEGPNVINPLGFLLADSFDSLHVGEVIDYTNRFRFDDIIECKNSTNLGYPKTVGDYVVVYGNDIISPWYEFKKYPVAASDCYIQWAWQETWSPLKRNFSGEGDPSFSEFITTYMENGTTGDIKGTYSEQADGIRGLHQSLTLNYPDYEYDWQNKEFRLTMDEGEALLKFKAPTKKDEYTGEYLGYPSFQLNEGPKRAINWAGEWLETGNADGYLGDESLEEFNTLLYETCVGTPAEGDEEDEDFISKWSDAVTLFDTGYSETDLSATEDDGRMILTVDGYGGRHKTYFQRGLNVEIIEGSLGRLPLILKRVTQFKQLNPFEEAVCAYFSTQKVGFTFENIKRTIGRFGLTFKFGSEVLSPEVPATDIDEKIPATYIYYHKPQVSIYSSEDGVTGLNLLYRSDGMELYDGVAGAGTEVRTVNLQWENLWEYIGHGKTGLYVEFRVIPSDNEIAEAGVESIFTNGINLVSVTCADIYEEVLVNASEKLNAWERKYYVSYGNSANCPPQGEEGAFVLTKLADNNSTCWQKDSADGVSGVPDSAGEMSFVSKVRGRIVFDAYEDGYELTGSIAEMENLQKKLYDQAAERAVADTKMTGALPPGLKQLLVDNGVKFTGPTSVSLRNSLITKLAEINQFSKMWAQGHSYLPTSPQPVNCGGINCIEGDAFSYNYTNLDDGSYHSANDSFSQYYLGTKFLMERRSIECFYQNTLFPAYYSRDTKNSIYSGGEDGFSTLIYPTIPIKAVTGTVYGASVPSKSNPVLPFYWGGFWGISQEPIYGYDPGW